MKTILQWFKEWNHPAAPSAIEYVHANHRRIGEAVSLKQAIFAGLSWSRMPQGSLYWTNIYESLSHENPTPADTPEPKPTTPTHMYDNKPLAKPTLVYGTDVATMSEPQVISAIKGIQGEIKKVDELLAEIPSTRLTQNKAGLQEALAELVARLDSFTEA